MLERILNSNGQIVPETGFVGFVLHNWVTLAIVTMLLGFVIDQVLYFVRYRPQDDWKHAYYSFRRFLTDKFGAKPAEEPEPREEHNPLEDTGVTERRDASDAVYVSAREPVIRRVQATQRRTPEQQEPQEPVYTRPQLRRETENEPQVTCRAHPEQTPAPRKMNLDGDETDEDAPIVVRQPEGESSRTVSEEPTTIRPQ